MSVILNTINGGKQLKWLDLYDFNKKKTFWINISKIKTKINHKKNELVSLCSI